MTVYGYSVQDARGGEISLADYQGTVLLIVNTASKCGFTPQYAGLQHLYDAWHGRGLEILALPCDQFGNQEPGTNDEIQQFCQLNYGVTFPVLAKIEVNGEGAHLLYRHLTAQQSGPRGADIDWNFTKFLIDRRGNVVARFEPGDAPEALAPHIEQLLEEEV
jgi:glutathione peroxidase